MDTTIKFVTIGQCFKCNAKRIMNDANESVVGAKKYVVGKCRVCNKEISRVCGNNCIYLFDLTEINNVNGTKLYKYGISNDVYRRGEEHEKVYGDLKLVYCIIGIGKDISYEIETAIKEELKEKKLYNKIRVGASSTIERIETYDGDYKTITSIIEKCTIEAYMN